MQTGQVEKFVHSFHDESGNKKGFYGWIRPDADATAPSIFFHGRSADLPQLLSSGALVSFATRTDKVGRLEAHSVKVLGSAQQ
jgi:hypothetical protein